MIRGTGLPTVSTYYPPYCRHPLFAEKPSEDDGLPADPQGLKSPCQRFDSVPGHYHRLHHLGEDAGGLLGAMLVDVGDARRASTRGRGLPPARWRPAEAPGTPGHCFCVFGDTTGDKKFRGGDPVEAGVAEEGALERLIEPDSTATARSIIAAEAEQSAPRGGWPLDLAGAEALRSLQPPVGIPVLPEPHALSVLVPPLHAKAFGARPEGPPHRVRGPGLQVRTMKSSIW